MLESRGDRDRSLWLASVEPSHDSIHKPVSVLKQAVTVIHQKLKMLSVNPTVLTFLARETPNIFEKLGIVDSISVMYYGTNEKGLAHRKCRGQRVHEMARESFATIPVFWNIS